jgi:stage V sporulation protein D (sporulation-specific penicillin-binding protein)
MNWRYRAGLIFFIIIFSLIIGRLFYWQVVRAQELTDLGRAQYGRRVLQTASRGEIKTSDGFSVVANKLTYLLFVNPKEVENSKLLAKKLSPILEMDEASISAKIIPDRFWVPLEYSLDAQSKEEIEKLEIRGIGFEQQTTRLYPEASMSARLFGFVGKDDMGENKGYFGLEGYYDRQLRGKGGETIIINDAQGRPILSKLDENTGKVDGRDLVLHVDRAIQYMLDTALKDGVDRYGASGGMAAIMDPKTGAIIAMSSFPSFDPAKYEEYSDKLYRDPFISDTYEPGSTFKPLIMASAIDAGAVKADTRCPICAGPIPIGEYNIKTWNNQYRANLTMNDVIVHSDNTGMVYVGRKLGLDRMITYLEKFGIGSLTGIDLQGEVVPGLREKDTWYPIDLATASFGQGISITPIELLTAFSSIANGGKRMEPHVVAKIVTPDGEEIKIQPKVLGRPISERSAKIITEMMVNAVDEGEAKFAKPKGYRIAGKTGTAQIPVAGHYDPSQTIASFVGFAPADDPRFLMLVVIDRPKSSIYGAETAAPIFFQMVKNLFAYYNIPPNE